MQMERDTMIGFQRLDWSKMPIKTVWEGQMNSRDAPLFKAGWRGWGFLMMSFIYTTKSLI